MRRPSGGFRERWVPTIKIERLKDIPEGETDHLLPSRRVLRSLPRPPRRSDTKPDRRRQAARVVRRSTTSGDESNEILQRIYGTAFGSETGARSEYLDRIEQARARDHRRLGPELGLFSFQRPGAGRAPSSTPGARSPLQPSSSSSSVSCYDERGDSSEVVTPQILDVELWHKSGHYEHYRDEHVLHRGRRSARWRSSR